MRSYMVESGYPEFLEQLKDYYFYEWIQGDSTFLISETKNMQ